MMRVRLDTRALLDPALAERGIGRYVRCLLDALGERVVTDGGARVDVVHFPSIDGVRPWSRAARVVTLHDLVPLKHPGVYLRTGLRHRARYAAVGRAARVIVPSRAVASDAQGLLGLGSDTTRVIPEAAAPAFRPTPRPDRLELPDRYLLWVGGLDPPDPRKRVQALAQTALRRTGGLPLVLAGRTGPAARELASPGRVILIGRLTDEELAGVYTGADALVFPSAEEGFGLPPVEALACGTPVAAFATGALIETLEDQSAAALVEPGDVGSLLDAAEALAGTRAQRPRRTWDDVAADTWAVYEEAAGA